MKKVIIFAVLLLGMAHTAFAGQHDVFIKFHRRCSPSTNTSVNRGPISLPIEVVYDSGTHKIEVTGDESLEAEVFLYDSTGSLENYSSSLNAVFTVLTSGTYIIEIQGDEWYAEGEIEVE